MKFIKRIIFILILLLIAFFIYRLISPQGATQLLYDLKSFSNTTLGTQFSLSGGVLTTSGTVLAVTGSFVQETGSGWEVPDDEELLLNDEDFFEESSITTTTTGSTTISLSGTSTPPSPSDSVSPTPSTPLSKPTAQTSSSNGLSAQEKRDVTNFLQNFGN